MLICYNIINQFFKGDFMLEKIAMWGGIAGIVVALVAIIVLFLTRANILDILDKDVILFDKNFELKKQAIETSMLMIDELDEKGEQAKADFEFAERAKKTYNELLCVVSDARVADEFYNLTLDKTVAPTASSLAHFKLLCRRDIGLSNKKSKLLKRAKVSEETTDAPTDIMSQFEQQSRPSSFNQPVRPIQPREPVQPREPIQPREPMQARPVRPMPARPTQPSAQAQSSLAGRPPMPRPVGRPAAPKDKEN